MSKAILVMDIPENCNECMLQEYDTIFCCCIDDKSEGKHVSFDSENKKHNLCPLQEINPNLIKALRCLASQDSYNNCYVNKYNRERGGKPKMTCKGILNTIPCPYSQEEYNTDFGSDECMKWLGELADILEGK